MSLRPRTWLVLVAGAAAIAWVQLAGVHEAARAWSVILLVPLPVLMIVEGRKLSELETLPRTEAYVSSIVSLWMLALATVAVAWASGYGASDLGFAALDGMRTAALNAIRIAALAAALTIAGVAVLFAFKFAGVREPALVRQLMPVTPRDRLLFVAVSLTAGICEEIVFRGFLIHVIYGASGSLALALILSSGVFGVAHAYQQPTGALRAGLLGLILALPLVITGSIIPSIIAHAAIDLLSGLWLSRYLLR
ncbi:MAG TPA: CPBP family intramembrane glutamic endopeptidase [Longimicrobiales bacterium]|nr:CPBP family intramembrane glutamic endopeptidase [Longimicrobiales bacterium]